MNESGYVYRKGKKTPSFLLDERIYLRDRAEYGAYNCLMRDLKVHDNVKLKNYLRIEPDGFEDLFVLVVIIYYLFNSCLFMIFQRQWRQ